MLMGMENGLTFLEDKQTLFTESLKMFWPFDLGIAVWVALSRKNKQTLNY